MNKKKILKYFLPVILIVCLCLTSFIFGASADMVLIEEEQNSELTYLSLEGQFNENVWVNKGSLSQGGGKYTLKSNGWAQWSTDDSMSMGYKHVKFNYSKKAQITAEVTMNSFDGVQENAGAGLMVRTGTATNSSCAFVHFRPNSVMITYRMNQGMNSQQGKTKVMPTKSLYPAAFKAVLIKGESKVNFYYKTGSGDYINIGAAPMVYGNDIYIGIGCYSQDETHMSTAQFSNFSYKVEAPEGYTIIDGETSEETPSEEEEIPDVYPEDLPVTDDVLLRETFTDGSMFNHNGEEQNDITNPIWKSNVEEPNIVPNADKTNRYISEYMLENQYYFAGDQSMTDYKLSADVCFTNEFSESENNQFVMMVRHTDIAQYGHMFYYLSFQKHSKKWSVLLGKNDSSKLPQDKMTVLTDKVVEFDYLDIEKDKDPENKDERFVGKWHKIEITAFDNIITASIDGTEILSYTDLDSAMCKTEGNIGFMTNKAAVNIDNITVTKLTDLLGGDYDNKIGGNWDRQEPAYHKEFADKNLPY
ncbi:MAG: DUF1080 domain-containing protein [Clostridia bacterium]|nr:DUF1080 domain-containing protein [Clostridia bacterium]